MGAAKPVESLLRIIAQLRAALPEDTAFIGQVRRSSRAATLTTNVHAAAGCTRQQICLNPTNDEGRFTVLWLVAGVRQDAKVALMATLPDMGHACVCRRRCLHTRCCITREPRPSRRRPWACSSLYASTTRLCRCAPAWPKKKVPQIALTPLQRDPSRHTHVHVLRADAVLRQGNLVSATCGAVDSDCAQGSAVARAYCCVCGDPAAACHLRGHNAPRGWQARPRPPPGARQGAAGER